LFFIGVNDARTQGPAASKTLVDPEETARNLAEVRQRVSRETKGVRFRNEDISRVAEIIAAFDGPSIELFTRLGLPPPQDLLMEDGLHFTQEGQKRIALEVVRGWADARAR
jgi:lysophospholipase L1-like esterase